MKNLLLLVVLIIYCNVTIGQSQMYRWALHPKQIDFTIPNSPVVQNLLPSYPHYASNAATDAAGNLLFHTIDLNIYNTSGTLIGSLNTAGFFPLIGNSMGIVPVPGSCKQYYLIFCLSDYAGFVQHQWLCYAKVDASSGTPVITQQTTGLLYSISGSAIGSVGFAISKVNLAASKRFLYFVGPDAYAGNPIVSRFDITSTGISSKVTIATTSTPGLSGSPYVGEATEVELSADGTKLAWVTGNSSEVNFVKVNALTGNFVSASSTAVPGSVACYGIEWNSASSIAYISHSNGLSRIAYPALTHTSIASSSLYNNTALELGRNNKIYAAKNTGNGFGEINTANHTVASSSLVISPTGKDFSNSFFTLPEQVDGEWSQFSMGPAINIYDTWRCATPGTTIILNAIPSTYTSYVWEKKIGGGAWMVFGGSGSSASDMSPVSATVQYRVRATIGGCTTINSPIATCTYCTGSACCPAPPVKREINPEILENAVPTVSLELQPNPTSGIFTLSTGANDIMADEIHIYDVNGRLVKSIVPEEVITNAISIDASDLKNGIYFVKLLNNATIHLSTKILIQK